MRRIKHGRQQLPRMGCVCRNALQCSAAGQTPRGGLVNVRWIAVAWAVASVAGGAAAQNATKPISPANVYEFCLPVETRLATEKKEDKPAVFAHFICTFYAGVCKDQPDADACQKAVKRYSPVEASR
ncbi:hypothetical protein AACH10_20835 [Ideonella sp. DXS22W]|uniref:Uncharacterized protein n=1 Tax=Pseudaquabacterium inlustre TaxID=2984192 RepID=A0ABU9CLL4_9BURK